MATERRQLTPDEVAALRELVRGKRTPWGAYAAIVAAGASLLSAVTASVVSIIDAFR